MKKYDYLRTTPFFWSRLGFCYDPPRYDKDKKPIIFSRQYDKYMKFHTASILHTFKVHTTQDWLSFLMIGSSDHMI